MMVPGGDIANREQERAVDDDRGRGRLGVWEGLLASRRQHPLETPGCPAERPHSETAPLTNYEPAKALLEIKKAHSAVGFDVAFPKESASKK